MRTGVERWPGIAGSPNVSGHALEKRLVLPISGKPWIGDEKAAKTKAGVLCNRGASPALWGRRARRRGS
jgi:hypothetical protein